MSLVEKCPICVGLFCKIGPAQIGHFCAQFVNCDVSCTKKPYGVATISRLLKITGLFCKRAPSKRLYSASETYDFKEPAYCSHPIFVQGSFAKEICWGVYKSSLRYGRVQGGEDAWDVLICSSFFAEEPLIIGLFCTNDLQRQGILWAFATLYLMTRVMP